MPSAAILAGGAASRFGGRDKSALVVGGRTILERQLTELSRVANEILLVGADSAAATRPAGDLRLHAVPDRVPGCGPLGGLDAALAAANNEVVFIVACDMPFVTSQLAAHFVALAMTSGDVERPSVVVPATSRGYHPLCAVYTRACQPVVARRIAERRLSLVDMLDLMRASGNVSVRVVTERELEAFGDPGHLLANVNTPAEYEELEALQGHHR